MADRRFRQVFAAAVIVAAVLLLGLANITMLERLVAPPVFNAGPWQADAVQTSLTLSGKPGRPVPRTTSVLLHAPQSGRPDRKYPLVVYVPGIGGDHLADIRLQRLIATHGYVTLGVSDLSHDYGIWTTADGSAPLAQRYGYDFGAGKTGRQALQRMDKRTRIASDKVSAILERLESDSVTESRLSAVLERVRTFQAVTVVGFSLGGAVAAQLCATDPRIQAVVNIDGANFADARSGLRCPYLMIYSNPNNLSTSKLKSSDRHVANEQLAVIDDFRIMASILDRHDVYLAVFPSAQHTDFAGRNDGRVPGVWKRLRNGSRYNVEYWRDVMVLHFLDAYAGLDPPRAFKMPSANPMFEWWQKDTPGLQRILDLTTKSLQYE